MKKTPSTRTRPRKRSQPNGNEFDTRQLLAALIAFKRCEFSARLPEDWTALSGEIADAVNRANETNERMTHELQRIVHKVRKERRRTRRTSMNSVSSWST